MGRRSDWKDYSLPGIYHITMRVDDEQVRPFGQVVGSLEAPAGSAEAPHVALTAVGEMVRHELQHAITAHYPMVEVQEHIVMPEHLHFIVQVHAAITSKSGRATHLGQVIAGFKAGCNRKYWKLTNQAAKPLGANGPAAPAAAPVSGPAAAAAPAAPVSGPGSGAEGAGGAAVLAPSGFAAGPKRRYSSGRAPLFHKGYCDVMPMQPGQLETQRAYINDNPRSRLLRSQNRSWMGVKRGGIATALTPKALWGYLRRVCPASACTDEVLAALGAQLLMAPDGTIACDTYGDRQLLERQLLPVVCHRNDKDRLQQHKDRCLQAARQGAVLVSARISKSEQDIMDTAMAQGFPVVLITDNGYTERYHPSADRLAQCANHRLLLITPWRYHYHNADYAISVAMCKAMNCVAQALCRKKDTWWQA